MAITSFKEIHTGRDGEIEVSKTQSVRRYIRVFRVATDNNYTEAAEILSSGSCPQVGNFYPDDTGAWCRRVQARNESYSKRVWIVTANYSSEFEIEDNPLADPAEIEWTTEQYQKMYERDKDNALICNSAGDPFKPAIEGDDARWAVTVRKNVQAVPTTILEYRNAVNSNAFTISGVSVAARCAKLSGIRVGPTQERNNVAFVVFSYTMHLNGDTWDKVTLDAGFRMKIAGTNIRMNIIGHDGQRVSSPVTLDGAGSPVWLTEDPVPGTEHYITSKIYPEQDFSILPMS